MDTWPELDQQGGFLCHCFVYCCIGTNARTRGIFRVIHILNTAADKHGAQQWACFPELDVEFKQKWQRWHRASGNWYKVFLALASEPQVDSSRPEAPVLEPAPKACDEDGSGSMTFDEMVGVCRKCETETPCMGVCPLLNLSVRLRDVTWWPVHTAISGLPGTFLACLFRPRQCQSGTARCGQHLTMARGMISCEGHPRILASTGCPSCREGGGLRKIHWRYAGSLLVPSRGPGLRLYDFHEDSCSPYWDES